MAKKQNPQILSPENYIRQRVRNLPLSQCYINDDWEKNGMAQITITRKHINGNITFCAYLVDLKCLGIKDTFFDFNIPEEGLEEFLDRQRGVLDITEADYNLVHNIIHAGWEYADGIGFKPHKDFLSTTQYMLEEDNDDIPIIDIQCGGEDGKPFYIQGPLDDQAKINRIISHLEKNVGVGNFDFMMEKDNLIFDEDEDEDEEYEDGGFDSYDTFMDEYAENSFEENRRLFFEVSEFMEHNPPSDEEEDGSLETLHQLEALTDLLYDELVDEKELSERFKRWAEEKKQFEITDKAYAQMLGLTDDLLVTDEDIQYLQTEQDTNKALKFIHSKWGKIPYYTFLETGQIKSPAKRTKKIVDMFQKYPDNAILKMEINMAKISGNQLNEEDLYFKAIFESRKGITSFEYQRLIMLRITYFLSTENVSGIESLYDFNYRVDDVKIDEDSYALIQSFLFIARVALMKTVLEKETDHN